MVTERRILHHGTPSAHRIEEVPEMWLDVVEIRTGEGERFPHRALGKPGIILSVPLLEVLIAQRARKTVRVIARRFIQAALRREGDGAAADLENALRALESVRLRRLGAEVEAHVHGEVTVVVENGVDVGEGSPVLPTSGGSHAHLLPRHLVHAGHEQHATYEMDEEIARHAGAVLLPRAPTREHQRIEWALRHGA